MFALGLLVAACGGPRIGGLSVRPVHLALRSDTEAVATLRYVNENILPVAISHVVGRLTLDGVYFAEVTNRRPLGLPATSAQEETVEFRLTDPAQAGRLRALIAAGHCSYRLEAEMFVLAGDTRDKVKTVSEGRLDLTAPPAPQERRAAPGR